MAGDHQERLALVSIEAEPVGQLLDGGPGRRVPAALAVAHRAGAEAGRPGERAHAQAALLARVAQHRAEHGARRDLLTAHSVASD